MGEKVRWHYHVAEDATVKQVESTLLVYLGRRDQMAELRHQLTTDPMARAQLAYGLLYDQTLPLSIVGAQRGAPAFRMRELETWIMFFSSTAAGTGVGSLGTRSSEGSPATPDKEMKPVQVGWLESEGQDTSKKTAFHVYR